VRPPPLSDADRLYLRIERIFDDMRREGVHEAEIQAVLQRLWASSCDLAASAAWQSSPRRR
jgi:hypothetical protein